MRWSSISEPSSAPRPRLAQAQAAVSQTAADASAEADARVSTRPNPKWRRRRRSWFRPRRSSRWRSFDLEPRSGHVRRGRTARSPPAELDAAKAGADAARSHGSGGAAPISKPRSPKWTAAEGRPRRCGSAISARRAHAAEALAQAAVKDAARRLSYVTIAAPAAGRIGNKNIEVGNRVQTGQTLMVLVEPQIWIEANFKETQLAQIRAGQRAGDCDRRGAGPYLRGQSGKLRPGDGSPIRVAARRTTPRATSPRWCSACRCG